MKDGVLVVVSGFSGAGKGTIVSELLRRHGDKLSLSVSATTRAPREGERDGVDYFFVTPERFREMIERDEFVEYAQFVNHSYGTPKAYVTEQLSAGKNVILEIEMQGALQIRKKYPDTVLIFVSTPSAGILKERLTGRGTESAEVVADRLSQANQDATYMPQYDYLVINDDLDTAVEAVYRVISAVQRGEQEAVSELRMAENIPFTERITRELKGFLKGDI